MSDSSASDRFWTLAELSQLVGGRFHGDPSKTVSRISSLQDATDDSIAHCSSDAQSRYLAATSAGIVILPEQCSWNYDGNRLIADNSRIAFGIVITAMRKRSDAQSGVHSTAVIGERCQISDSANIEANAVIGSDVQIEQGTCVGKGSVIGDRCRIAKRTHIEHNVTVYRDTVIGRDCRILGGAVIGASGFSYEWDGDKWFEVENIGSVVIGDNVSVGACTSIDRGSIGATRIGNGVKIDNNVQVGHNCDIGDHTLIVANAGIAGSVKIGKRCSIAGHSAIASHSVIADDVVIQAGSIVCKSLKKPGVYGATIPVREARVWQKTLAKLNRLNAS